MERRERILKAVDEWNSTLVSDGDGRLDAVARQVGVRQ